MSSERSRVYAEQGKVVLTIHGFYTGEQAEECIRDAIRLFKVHSPCDFVPDLVHMTGFDTGARVQWQENLSKMRPHIASLIMVGGSPLARMSGAAVCLYAGIKMRFADSLDEVFGNKRSA